MFVCRDNWTEAQEDGWRLAEPVEDLEYSLLKIVQLANRYGPSNICFGTKFEGMNPSLPCQLLGFAIYVRDLEEQLEELSEDIINFNCGHPMRQEEEELAI